MACVKAVEEQGSSVMFSTDVMQDDIYDIIGSMSDSYDEDRSMYSRRQARNNNNGARNSLASSSDVDQVWSTHLTGVESKQNYAVT